MKIKSILSIILTVCIMVTSFSLVVQAGEQTEEKAISSIAQVVEEIETKMQTAPKPTAITRNFGIDSKDKFIEFMTTPKYHESNFLFLWEINLLCDIDMGDIALDPINEYRGNFNGNGHVISGMSFNQCCFVKTNHGTISGINFQNCQQVNVVNDVGTAGFVIINEKDGIINDCFTKNDILNENGCFLGGFVGLNKGQINRCKTLGKVRGKNHVGGFAGWNKGKIADCSANGDITGNNWIGGFVGWNKGEITGCSADGNVNGNEYVGGLVGNNANYGEITNCTAKCNVNGNEEGEFIGGFVGTNANDGKITNCTAEGKITGDSLIGGFIGFNGEKGEIIGCSAYVNIIGNEKIEGFAIENKGTITRCTAEGKVTGDSFLAGFVLVNIGTIIDCIAKCNVTGGDIVAGFVLVNTGTITRCTTEGDVIGKERVGGFVGNNDCGEIIDSNSTGNVIVTDNDAAGAIGNGKVLDKKKVTLGTIIAMMLAGTIGGVTLKTIGVDKVGNTLRSLMDIVKTFFNEKVMSNSNYKKVIGALIVFGIAAIIIIVPIEKFRKKNNIDISIGGFVGYNGGKIENCTSSGKVTVKKVSMRVAVGGFAGINEVTGTITNCEAEEYVHANTKLSGKAGGFVGDNNGRIYKSKFSGERVYLSTGILYKDDCCGGFAGKNSAGGVIDWCKVGQVKAEPVGNGKKVGKGITTVETTNKTKGGGLVGVAGKLSITTNCTYNARRKANIGEVGVNPCYKIEKIAVVRNCYSNH